MSDHTPHVQAMFKVLNEQIKNGPKTDQEGVTFILNDLSKASTGERQELHHVLPRGLHLGRRGMSTLFNIRTMKVGGLRFIRIGRLCFSYSISAEFKEFGR
ncbi:MAG: hypothetical protein EOQ89_03605 [Mesorhizobium sp.]|nr:MAG: hypothetical protein EOQ89_03605 [Mesorhizobium sp.]